MAPLGARAAFSVIATLLAAFSLLSLEVLGGHTKVFDAYVAAIFHSGGMAGDTGWLHEMARDITALGSMVVLFFILAVIVGYLLLQRRRGPATLMTGSVLGGAIVSFVLKLIFHRPRPDLPPGIEVFSSSFPSSHAMLTAVSFLTAGALMSAFQTSSWAKAYCMVVAVFLTFAIGVSRVYLGVHYATDVIAGWCVGSAWATLCWISASWLQRRRQPW